MCVPRQLHSVQLQKEESRGGSFSQKSETANPRCELVGCVHRPTVDSESTIVCGG
jgi:hypothetical protein